jgi:hypothetical protein
LNNVTEVPIEITDSFKFLGLELGAEQCWDAMNLQFTECPIEETSKYQRKLFADMNA